jgi:putative peptidoglycan lipid II flippase
MIMTYACYARKDTGTPLRSMLLQATICLALASTALLVRGPAVLLVLGLALSVSVASAALHLTTSVWRNFGHAGSQRLGPSLVRFVAGAAIMAGPAWLVTEAVAHWLPGSVGSRVAIGAAVLTGAAVFLAVQTWWRTPAMGWLAGGLSQRWAKDNRVMAEAING